MPALPPVRPIRLDDVRAAWKRIEGVVLRTPLVKLRHDAESPEVWLKLENLQPINSFKLRGAANAVAMLSPEARGKGVWTISAGNAGQGVAFAARGFGVPCTVVAIETAPETKVQRMRRLGARIVKAPFDACWRAMEERVFPGVEGTFVHPFDDEDFIAGNATIGPEILEELPGVRTVITAFGGGGLARRRRERDPRERAPRTHPRRRARDRRAGRRLVRGRRRRARSRAGSRRSSTAPAARASFPGCGSGCKGWSTDRSSCRSTRRGVRCASSPRMRA